MEFVTELLGMSLLIAGTVSWAKWSNLDLGFRAPVLRDASHWILVFILWCAVEGAIQNVYPTEVNPAWLEWMEQQSPLEELAMGVILAPLFEELLFRGALFSALMRRWGIGVAATVPSVVWGLLHFQYEAWVAASIAGSGIVLAIIRWKSGSIYAPLALHSAFNLAAMISAYPPFAAA